MYDVLLLESWQQFILPLPGFAILTPEQVVPLPLYESKSQFSENLTETNSFVAIGTRTDRVTYSSLPADDDGK